MMSLGNTSKVVAQRKEFEVSAKINKNSLTRAWSRTSNHAAQIEWCLLKAIGRVVARRSSWALYREKNNSFDANASKGLIFFA